MTQDLFQYLPPQRQITLNTYIPRCCFGRSDNGRIAVSVLLFDERGHLALIHPAAAPAHRDWFIPVQEKARSCRSDRTVGGVGLRCLQEELGLTEDAVTFHPRALLTYRNHTPARHGKPATTKHIIVLGAYVPAETTFRPNRREVRKVEWIRPTDLLDALPQRPTKFCGVVEACHTAVGFGLLPEKPWGEVLAV